MEKGLFCLIGYINVNVQSMYGPLREKKPEGKVVVQY